MRNSRAMCGTLEKFAHSDFNLPMTAIAGIKQNACPFSFRRPCFSLVRRGLFAPPQTGFSVCPAPSGCTTKPAGPRHFTATAGAVGYACVVHHTPFCAKLQEFLSQFASLFSPWQILPSRLFLLSDSGKRARTYRSAPILSVSSGSAGIRPLAAAAVIAAVVAAAAAAPAPAAAAAAQDDDENDDPKAAPAAKTVIAAPHVSTSCYESFKRGCLPLSIPSYAPRVRRFGTVTEFFPRKRAAWWPPRPGWRSAPD